MRFARFAIGALGVSLVAAFLACGGGGELDNVFPFGGASGAGGAGGDSGSAGNDAGGSGGSSGAPAGQSGTAGAAGGAGSSGAAGASGAAGDAGGAGAAGDAGASGASGAAGDAGAAGASGASGASGAAGAGGGAIVSFAASVQSVLEQRCTSCHEDGTAEGLFIRKNQATDNYKTLTEKETACDDKFATYTVAGQPETSYLYLKVSGTAAPGAICGMRMPPNTALPANEVEIIRQWILTGANP